MEWYTWSIVQANADGFGYRIPVCKPYPHQLVTMVDQKPWPIVQQEPEAAFGAGGIAPCLK
jgi:hypothetical protein